MGTDMRETLTAPNVRREQIMEIMRAARDNTLARPASRRGPYIIADAALKPSE